MEENVTDPCSCTEQCPHHRMELGEEWYETHWTDRFGDQMVSEFRYDEPLRQAWARADKKGGTVYKCTSWVTREVVEP